jgi:hypothetical protein
MPEVVTLAANYRVAHHERPVQVQHKAIQVIANVVEKYGLQVDAFKGDKEYQDYVAELYPSDIPHHSDLKRRDEVDYNGTLVIRATKAGAAPVSPVSGPIWEVFSGTIQHAFARDNKTVVPVGDVMTGNTDTRHYLSKSHSGSAHISHTDCITRPFPQCI